MENAHITSVHTPLAKDLIPESNLATGMSLSTASDLRQEKHGRTCIHLAR